MIWRFDMECFFGNGMFENKCACMKQLSRDTIGPSYIRIKFLITICLVCNNRTANMCHMDTYLMSTPRLDTTFEERYIDISFFGDTFFSYCLIVGYRRLSIIIHSNLCLIASIFYTKEPCFYGISGFCRITKNNSMIDLLDTMRL